MRRQTEYWTNPSVIAIAGISDPVDFITKKAREVALSAIDSGWKGPPYDPFKLADLLKISTVPNEGLFEARTVPVGSHRFRIEYNPNKPHGRIRFSVSHELAHTLFPDCGDTIRERRNKKTWREDEWQLELLCNIAAAELLMPLGSGMDLEREKVSIDNILKLQKKFDVSTETISRRLVNLTAEPCTFFAAARIIENGESNYRVDYSVSSRSSKLDMPSGFIIPKETVVSECVAIGFTAKGSEKWGDSISKVEIECVGIPPYPRHIWPRIAGIARGGTIDNKASLRIRYLMGDALEPRGSDHRIIAHIVNDKTPNWGAGFPLEVKRKWPSVQQDFKEWVTTERERLHLGEIQLSPISNKLDIVHMIAQHGYGPSSKPRIRYEALRTCLDMLGDIALQKKANIHMPRIGSGQAGGNWAIIADLIIGALVNKGIDVTIYDLPGTDPLAPEQFSLSFQPFS